LLLVAGGDLVEGAGEAEPAGAGPAGGVRRRPDRGPRSPASRGPRATFHLPDGRTVAVCNPCNEAPRTNSDIAHELAHILLDHDVREIQQLAGHTFLTCNPEQEEEANWLAGCLLLPRPLLLREVYAGTDPETLAAKYQVSLRMARFRLNASGVLLQARRARATRGT
jgi:Zn-dependent peptidase ImmA (M78 family)